MIPLIGTNFQKFSANLLLIHSRLEARIKSMRAGWQAAASSTLEDENLLAKQIELLKTAFGRYNEKSLGGVYTIQRGEFLSL